MLKKILKTILGPILGKRALQPFFEKLHLFSMAGMNCFKTGVVKESGEIYTIEYVRERTKDKKEPVVIFDVGAHIGDWTRQCLEAFGQRVNLYAFEPSQKTFSKLNESVSKFFGSLIGKNIFLLNFGFSDKEGTAKLFYEKDCSVVASLYKRKSDHFGYSMDYGEEVKIKTIDVFCRENNISKIHFLKLDAEGHELKILKGAERMIDSSVIDYIQFEFGGCNIDSRTYFQDFFYFLIPKYKIYRICKDGLREIKTYKEQYEIFSTINYFAEKRALR